MAKYDVRERGSRSTPLFLPLFDPLHYSSAALIIKHAVPSLWSPVSVPESTQEATNPQTLEILGFLRWCCSGEFSNRSAIYFCAWVRGWETSKEFDYSIMCLSQKGAGAWAAYARGIAARLNLLSLRGWCHFSPLCHSSFILIPQYVHLLQCFNGHCEMHKHSHWIKPQITVQCGLRISQLLTHVTRQWITVSINDNVIMINVFIITYQKGTSLMMKF